MLSVVGFLIIASILYLIMSKKLSAVVALVAVPVIGMVILGQTANIGKFVTKGIAGMASTGVMFIFAILFFSIMRDAGAFDPVVNFIIKKSRGNPLLVVLGTFAIAAIGHLDGAGATTFLLVIPAMLPIYKRMEMNPLILTAVTAMAAGTMNILPWGGPTLRAATVLQMDVMELFRPMIIPQIAGMIAAFGFSYMLGRSEQKRLQGRIFDAAGESTEQSHKTAAEQALARPKLIIPNIILIVAVIGIMISGKLPPAVAFMIGTAVAMILNYPDSDTQRKLVDTHAMEAMLMASVLFAAGALMGIFQNSGMAKAMAQTMVSVIPTSLGQHIPAILGYLSMPLSLAFDPDSYYFAVMPVIAKATEVFGANAVDVARASIVGQITVGFPISPLTPSTFLLIGLAGVELGDHQKFAFKYLFAISAVIMTVALLMGVIPL